MRRTTCLFISLAVWIGTLATAFPLLPDRVVDAGSVPFGVQSVITDAADGAYSVYAADVDSDGDLDVLSASRYDDKVAWYENDGGSSPVFTGHVITTAADGAFSVHAADVDGDGHLDVLSASLEDDTITWYENDGALSPTFTAHVITTAADGAYSVYAADVDGDDDLDVLSASGTDDTIAWYENDGASPPTFIPHVITTAADGARSVYTADVDGDGDLDVIAASRDDNTIAWYGNGGGSPPTFSRHVITTNAIGATSVCTADVDDDGDVDVLSSSRDDNTIAWYENGGGSSPAFTRHIIATNASGARAVWVANVDSDGDLDVLSASLDDDKVAWYESSGGSPPTFTGHVITTNADGAHSVYAADVDDDGDLDVLSASERDDKIAWYENRGGQFALVTTDSAPATIVAGQQDDMLRIVVTHRGRAGDTDAELATLELLFEEGMGDPLTTAEANALIENLHIYRDDGSGSFEPVADTLVATISMLSLVAGVQTVTFADGDPDVRVPFGSPVLAFVVTQLTSDAARQTPDQFRVTHVTEAGGPTGPTAGSAAEDRDSDLPLTLEFAPNVASVFCTASAPDADGDPYEPDDTCIDARTLAFDGTAQHHTFHDYADTDWARFTAISGTTYIVQATSTSPRADMVLELHSACGQPPLPPDDEDTFGNDARLVFTAPAAGIYYVRAVNHDPAACGPHATYELSVRAQSPAPVVVIVAGRNQANQLEANIVFMGDQAYRSFRRAGTPRENIHYLSVGAGRDADQDGHLDVDGAPTWENVRYAVRDWPRSRGVRPGVPFYLYMVDHGGTDYYCAEGCGEGGRVSAADLNAWLSNLEVATRADEVNVIVEACYSGSFIDSTTYGPAEISSPRRVVITSTGSRVRAFASKRGGYFSDAFFTALGENMDLCAAYESGRTAAQAAWPEQTPWLDDNGDAVADENDCRIARGRGLMAFGGGAIPVVDWLEVGRVSTSGVATITAQVRDDVAVVTVTVEVYAPGLEVPETGEGETPVLPVDRVDLRDEDDDGVYDRTYAGFTEKGVYRLVAYGWDNDGNLSLPRQVTVGARKVFLPMVIRSY